MRNRLKVLFWAGLFSLFITSCHKNEVETIVSDDVIDQEIIIENLLADIDAFSEDVINNQLGFLKSAESGPSDEDESCPVITYYRNSDPRKMIIDFGTECEGEDGRIRSGKIIITSSSFENLMATRTKTFENFSVDGRGIDGIITKTITLNREDRTRVATVSEELTITKEDKTAHRTGTMTRTHDLGERFDRKDDVFTSWGEIITEWENDVTVTKTIGENNPLVFKALCRQIVSGILSVTAGDKSWSIDYGQGDCDNLATINRNGTERQIRIGRK